MVLPGGEHQQLTSGTGLHAAAAGFRQVGEAVFLKHDEGQAFLEGCAHDLLLALGDAWRYQHGSAAGLREPPRLFLGYLLVGEAAGALYLQAHGALQQEAVADGRALLAAYHEAALHAEELGVLALQEEAAGIVAEVVQPSLQLPLAQEELVVEATGKEQAVGAVVLLPSSLLL